MKLTADTEVLVSRLRERMKSFNSGSKEMQLAGVRIGLLLENQVKINIRQRKLIKTGYLLNSISHRLLSRGDSLEVQVGSFGVTYAKVHEFGFDGQVDVKEHKRLGRPVRAHSRHMKIIARPYVRPALEKQSKNIVNILRQIFGGA
jgi:hypothetical protein